MPKFSLDVNNITTRDIWFDFFKNLGRMENIDPSVYERADEGLLRLIEKAKIGALSEKEHRIYEASLKALEDEVDMEEAGYERGLEDGRKEGIEEGRKEGIEEGRKNNSIQIAKEMKKEATGAAMAEGFFGNDASAKAQESGMKNLLALNEKYLKVKNKVKNFSN